mmetsp:Transcript_69978/g.216357  ORF Transcript_69978/g.216357 Transcript_69978/m.216357 type:complete len:395 (+) Transcript_69978:61-1245(+)
MDDPLLSADGGGSSDHCVGDASTNGRKYVWLATFLLGTLVSTVAGKRVQLAAPEYPMALVQLLAISGVIVYPLLVIGAVASGQVSPGQLLVEWWKPAVVGTCFVLHDMLLQIGGRGALPGVLILVLMKLVIPCSMVMSMSKHTLCVSYCKLHWAGMVVLLAGVLMVVPGQLTHFQETVSPVQATFQALLVAASVLPEAAAFVFLELWLKGDNKHMYAVAFWMWVCLFMLPIIEILVPLGAVLSGVQLPLMWSNIYNGFRCYVVGMQPQAEDDDGTGVTNVTNASIPPRCVEACRFWWGGVLFALASNVSMPMCTRHGSATLLWFVRALVVPLGGLLFASSAVMGDHAIPMQAMGWIGLFLVMCGVFLFNSRDPIRTSSTDTHKSREWPELRDET